MFLPSLFTKALLTAASFTSSIGCGELGLSQTILEAAAVHGGEIGFAAPPHTFSQNYAGVYLNGTKGDYNFITAEFNVPPVKPPAGNPPTSQVSSFIGFDTLASCPFQVRAGIQVNVDGGRASYRNFYHWVRADGFIVSAGFFPELNILPNHELKIALNATSPTRVVVSMSVDSGTIHSEPFAAPFSDLCLASAGWFVHADLSPPIANFGDVAYNEAKAQFQNGTSAGPFSPNAVVVNIRRGDTTFTETGTGEQSVTVRYTQ